MPIYEYQCAHCQHAFELMQKISDKPVTHCEQCGQDQVARLVSAAGFQLKGSGWYVTDFKNKNKPSAEAKTTTEKGSAD
jgi:putative FmdB family regulatory protein